MEGGTKEQAKTKQEEQKKDTNEELNQRTDSSDETASMPSETDSAAEDGGDVESNVSMDDIGVPNQKDAPVNMPLAAGAKPKPRTKDGKTNQTPEQPHRHNKRLPVRIGITWEAGAKLEAKDFLEKWYPAKIVEVDTSDLTVLIHFEGWNQRYDEWVDMASDRLRPVTRHSERKEKRKSFTNAEPKVGDCVFARWTDCRLYPAKILSLLPNGAFEVLFYDGFKKVVQPLNIKPMPAEMQQEYAKVLAQAATGTPGGKRRRSRETRERSGSRESSTEHREPPVKRVKERTPSGEGKSVAQTKVVSKTQKSDRSTPKEWSQVPSSHITTRRSCMVRRLALTAPTTKSSSKSRPPSRASISGSGKKNKLIIGGVFQAKKLKSSPPEPHSEKKPNEETEAEIPEDEKAEEPEAVKPEGKKKSRVPSGTQTPSAPAPDQPPLSSQELMDKLDKVWAPKEFKVENDHNQYKCPFENCGKGFRKETLLEYHIKYYHTEDGSPVQPPPAKKRKKTLSVCSTDSDISVGGRSSSGHKAAKKKGSSASISAQSDGLPDIPSIKDEAQATMDDAQTTTTATDDLERQEQEELLDTTEESEEPQNKDEVVNCICQINEENGLMILCDTCQCWQHAACVGITEETLPNRYVCDICQNPLGVRENAQYMWNQDWWKEGTLACFRFLPNCDSDRQPPNVRATHDLIADMLNVTTVLKGLRRKLHAAKDKNNPEVKRWTIDWDKEMERRKQEEQKLLRDEEQMAESMADQTEDHDIEKDGDKNQGQRSEDMAGLTDKETDLDSTAEYQFEKDSEEMIDLHSDGEEKCSKPELIVNSENNKQDKKENDIPLLNDTQKSVSEKVEAANEQQVEPPVKPEPSNEPLVADVPPIKKQSELDSIKDTKERTSTNSDKPDKSCSSDVVIDKTESTSSTKQTVEPEVSKEAVLPRGAEEKADTKSAVASDTKLPVASEAGVTAGGKDDNHGTDTKGDTVQTQAKASVNSQPPAEQKPEAVENEVEVEVEVEDLETPVDPLKACQDNLMHHVTMSHDLIETRLDSIEEQVTALEAREGHVDPENILSDLPQLKKSLHQLLRDLAKVNRMSMYHC